MANNTGQKFGGRKSGTQNKTSKQIKEILNDILIDEIQAIPDRLTQLSDKDRLDIVVKLLPFLLPKQKEDILIHNSTVNIPPIHWVGSKE